jgi:hypothetical protein
VTVGPDHNIPWQNQSFFGEKGMLDPNLSNLKVIRKAMGLRKIPKDFTLLGRKNVLSRREVIGNKDDTIPMEDFLRAHLLKGLDGKRRRDIVAESQIDPSINQIAGKDLFFPGVGGQYLFCNRHWMSFGH